jgi:hypothetical protein
MDLAWRTQSPKTALCQLWAHLARPLAIVRGKAGTIGNALLEIYKLAQ